MTSPSRAALRAWTGFNLLVSTILILAWWLTAAARSEALVVSPHVHALPAGSVQFSTPTATNPLLVIHCTVPLSAREDLPAAAPDTLLRLHPALPGRLRFAGQRRLEFTPDGPWPAATVIDAALDPTFVLPDQSTLGSVTARFTPRPLALANVMIRDGGEGPQTAGHELRLLFTLPVVADDLARALTVEPAAWAVGRLAPISDGSADGSSWSLSVTSLATPSPEAVVLRLAGDLHPAGGGQPLGEAVRQQVLLVEAATLTDLSATNDGLRLRTSHELAMPEADALVTVPPRTLRWQRDWSGLIAHCDLKPGELVRVRAAPGFPGRGRFRIAAPIDDVLRIADAPASLEFPQRGSVLSASALPLLEIAATNVERVRLRLRRIYDNNAVRFAQRTWSVPDSACTPWRSSERVVAGVRNERRALSVDLRELWNTPTLPAGWYEIEAQQIQDDRDWGCHERKLVQISDLACTVRHAGGDVAVRVWSLASGAPMAGARIEVLSPTNQRLCAGDSGADGSVVLHHATDAEDATPYLIEVRHGDDALAVDLERFPITLVEAQFAGATDPLGNLDGWLWPERGLVRPGEELRVAGLVRDVTGRAPLGQALDVRVLSPDRKLATSVSLNCPADGLIDVRHQLPHDAWQGGWRVELWTAGEHPTRLADTAVRVETFVPDRIVAETTLVGATDGTVVADGADLAVNVHTRWRTGEPAACAVEARLRIEAADLVGTGTATGCSFALSRGAESWSDVPDGVVCERNANSGDDGAVTLRLELPRQRPQIVRARVDVAASEPGGRPVPADAGALVLTAPAVLGVTATLADGHVTARAVFAGRDGAPVTIDGAVRLRLERRRWLWDLRDVNGRLRWDTRVQREELAVADCAPGVETLWPAPTASADSWLVVSAARGDHVLAEQVVGAAPLAPDRLRLLASGPVKPGDSVRVTCASPIAGEALVTLEGVGIVSSGVYHLQAGETQIDLPIPATITRSTLHVVAVLASPQRGQGEGRLWLAGGARITVQQPGWSCPVTLAVADGDDPDGVLSATVHAPGARRALVVAVDEAVLARTRHPQPDPLAWFHRARAATGRGTTSLADLLERPRWPLEPGGDGDDSDDDPFAARLATRSSDLDHLGAFARWQLVELDAAGDAAVPVSLGGFEGSARVVTIAMGDTVCGAAARTVTVRAPLGVRVALPRVVAPGDHLRATLTITARSSAGLASVTVDGGAHLHATEQPTPLSLVANQPAVIEVPIDALAAGTDAALTITVHVRSDDGQLRERRIVARLPVRSAARFVEEQLVVPVDGASVWTPAGQWQEPPTVTVTVPKDRREELRPALDHVIQYPYGCGEQVATQVQVLAACAGLASHLDGTGVERAHGMLPHGVERLRGLERGDGFPYWQGGDADPVLTVHAVAALLAANGASDNRERERWLDLVDGVVRRDQRMTLRCQGVATLAAGHRPVNAWLEALGERTTGIEERSWLALASAWSGDRERARALLDAADPATAQSLRESSGLLRSPVRSAAIELRARLACADGQARIAMLAERLIAAVRSPRGLTTQELAHVLPALDAWQAVQADLPPIAVNIDGHETAPGTSATLHGAIALHSDRPTTVLISVSGWRSDAPAGTDGIRIQRRFRRWRDGIEVTHLVRGEIYAVELLIDSPVPIPGGVLTDLFGGGWEAEARPPGPAPRPATNDNTVGTLHVEAHDDRVFLVHAGLPAGRNRLVYAVRAITVGLFSAGAATLEAFYDPTVQGSSDTSVMEVVAP